MDGWICLHRKIRQNPIFNDLELLRLWLIVLTEASHTDRVQIIGRQSVELSAGQFITGRFALHQLYNNGLKSTHCKSEKTVWRWLEFLQKSEFLTINSNTKFSLITVLNWHIYQVQSANNDQQVTNKRPSNDQQVTTNNNVNNYNNDNKVDIKRSRHTKTYDEDSSPYRLAAYLYKKISEWTDRVKQPNMQTWANECRKILDLDKRDRQLVKDVIDWATADNFWQSNILSPSKLRSQFERLTVEMDKNNAKLKLVYSRGEKTDEQHERTGNSGSIAVGTEQDLDIFVRR